MGTTALCDHACVGVSTCSLALSHAMISTTHSDARGNVCLTAQAGLPAAYIKARTTVMAIVGNAAWSGPRAKDAACKGHEGMC